MTIKKIDFSNAIEERYLSYALSTITHRALPDIRDGLKPVHRRLLYAMHQLKLNNNSGFKKSARVVGDVIGKYHPHGDQSVYEALVRLTQNFSTRYPLIDGQGNFGNIDGDNAAAMRYTEARLTPLAEIMLKDIAEDTVDLIKTYDGVEQEPIVLPSAFPNLLANGSTGIAVGMATNIPPHNIEELFKALIKTLKKNSISNSELFKIVTGPDFPTGGEIVDSKEAIKEAYAKGKGTLRLRARWKEESLGRGQYQIVIYEIPYQVNKSRIIEKISYLIDEKKINYLETIQDESAEDIRVVLIPKNRTFKSEVVMEDLFKNTDLEIRFSINLNAINSKLEPKIFNLKDTLRSFLDHRFSVLKRRCKFRLIKTENRIEILKGFLIVFSHLNQVIKIIRTETEPEKKLMKTFKINSRQAEAILAMRLRQLKKLEEKNIKDEHKGLLIKKKELELILKSKSKQISILEQEFQENLLIFKNTEGCSNRRTIINHEFKSVDYEIEEFETREPITVILSKNGWIKLIKGHQDNYSNIKYKDGDFEKSIVQCKNNDNLLLFSSLGKFYSIKCSKINSGRGYGDPISAFIDRADNEEIIFATLYDSKKEYLIASSSGKGFFVNSEHLSSSTKSGKKVMNLKANDKAISCNEKIGDSIATLSGEKKILKLLIFDHKEIPTLTKGTGVILQKFKTGKMAIAVCLDSKIGLVNKISGKVILGKIDSNLWFGKRAQSGKIQPKNIFSKL